MNANPTINMISIELIIPNRFQPRSTFDEQGINELSASIKEHGIIQPLVLRKLGEKYEIIAGERRYKAATVAGLTEVPAIISNLDDNQSAEVALVENVQRKNLTSIEEAKSYKKILEKGYLTQESLAKKMGISQSAIANKLRLLNLTSNVQEALLNGRISERHARSLLSISNAETQVNMLNKVIEERMTVRKLDAAIKELIAPDMEPKIDIELTNINTSFEPNSKPTEILVETEEEPEILEDELEKLDLEIDINNKNDLEEMKNNAEDIIKDPQSKIFNIFDQGNYKSLEDEAVNLSVTNVFDETPTDQVVENLQAPEIVPEVTVIQEPEVPESLIKSDDLKSVIRAYDSLEQEVLGSGYKISTEEFDFEDLYQIIIKIEKENK